jgi:hypothetical protein
MGARTSRKNMPIFYRAEDLQAPPFRRAENFCLTRGERSAGAGATLTRQVWRQRAGLGH